MLVHDTCYQWQELVMKEWKEIQEKESQFLKAKDITRSLKLIILKEFYKLKLTVFFTGIINKGS